MVDLEDYLGHPEVQDKGILYFLFFLTLVVDVLSRFRVGNLRKKSFALPGKQLWKFPFKQNSL